MKRGIVLLGITTFGDHMKIISMLTLFLLCCIVTLSAQIIPHPLRTEPIPADLLTDNFNETKLSRNQQLTNNILVIRIDFPDKPFNSDIRFPAFHPHDYNYFNKHMINLRDYYLDASYGLYDLKYTMAPNVYTMSNPLSYYGDDNYESIRRIEMIGELIEIIGTDLSFKDYEALIIFHSGAGQESDIFNSQSNALFSGFISIASFRYVFDPDNPDYKGIPTADGSFISRVLLAPSEQYHPDHEENYHFEILGLLATQYGRVMGLPSLWGNVAAYGSHAGTGNFCVMGTGTWNNNGKTPPLPSAWVRYFAGWEEPVLVEWNAENIYVPHVKHTNARVIKIPISDKEYYLIENRQHDYIKDQILNIDTNEWLDRPVHSFELLPDDQQDWAYSELRDGSGTVRFPMVNLITNNLRYSEWDYFMPYTPSYDPNGFHDPSGLLIWHIDENIIEANFATNTINANPRHRGVALKEADGVQHMTSPVPHYYMRGGPFKAYRADNNSYLGEHINPETGYYSFPDASSNYGGIRFEIYNVSYSEDIMNFSVKFEAFSEVEFHHENYLEPFVFDFNKNGINTVHYFHSDGYISLFENNIRIDTVSMWADTLAFNYTFDGKGQLIIPAQDKHFNTRAKLMLWDGNNLDEIIGFDNATWSDSVVYIDDEWIINGSLLRWILKLNYPCEDSDNTHLVVLDDNFNQVLRQCAHGASNFAYHNKQIKYFVNDSTDFPRLYNLNINLETSYPEYLYDENFDLEGTWKIYQGDFWGDNKNYLFLHYNHLTTNRFFLFEEPYESGGFGESGGGFKEINIHIPYRLTGQPVFVDVTQNGVADIILSHANGFYVFTMNGSFVRQVMLSNPDPLNQSGSGLIALHPARSGELRSPQTIFFGGFSRNRLVFFDSNFNIISSLSKTLSRPMQALPYISTQNNDVIIYQATDNGRIHNILYPDALNTENLNWHLTLGNYYRNAYWSDDLENTFAGTTGIFVKDETYAFPSPLMKRHHEYLRFNVMTTVDTLVEISIYTIAGQLVTKRIDRFIAYEGDRAKFIFEPDKWASGMYFAVLKARNDTLTVKFAIEG